MTVNNGQYLFLLPLGIYCMILPFEGLLTLGSTEAQTTISKYVGLLVIYLFSINWVFLKPSFRQSKARLWLVLYVGFACLSLAWSIDPEKTIERIPTQVNLLLFYLVVGTFRTDRKGFDIMIRMIVAGGIATALFLIYDYYFLGTLYTQTMRASIAFGETAINPNSLAFLQLLPFGFLLSRLTQARGLWQRLGYLLAFSAMGYAMLVTGSRGGMLGMLVIVSFYFCRKSFKGTRFVAIALIIVTILVGFTSDIFIQRMTFQQEKSLYSRELILLTGLSALPHYWLLGGGMDTFPTLFFLTAGGRHYGPHNIYLGTLLELGLVGLSLFALALVYHFKSLRTSYPSQADTAFALMATLTGMLVMAASIDILWMKSFWTVLALTMMLSNATTEAARQR